MAGRRQAVALEALRATILCLRDASWLTARRVRAYALIVLAVIMIGLIVDLVAGPMNLATDFRSFWAASKLALEHDPLGAYRPLDHYAVERTAPGLEHVGWAAFFYPPIFLLICLPLALLPFWWSALGWVAATGALFLASIHPIIPRVRSAWLVVLVFPALWLNAGGGQSAALAAALFTFAARWLERRPALAGICFGCLAFKPQLGLVVPVALVAAARWRTLAAACATVGTLMTASVALFGAATWSVCLNNLVFAKRAIDDGDELPSNIPTMGGALRLLGASTLTATIFQAATALLVCIYLWRVARRRPGAGLEGSAICIAAMLCSPWLHYYDLVVLAFPIAWLAGQGLRSGWLPWEKFILLTNYGLPAAIALAMMTRLPVAPLIIAALFGAVWRRAET